MTDLIKREDALAAIQEYAVQEVGAFRTPDLKGAADTILALPAIDPAAIREAALQARIEALTKERDEAWKRAAHSEKVWGEAEVKLGKAVEAAEELSAALYSDGNVTERHLRACKAGVKLHATLAEIKGESHE